MAVYPVGAATNTHSTTGSVTGTWSALQTRVAGHLLVAMISCAASTSVTATATSSGWTNLFEVPNSGTANVRVACWTKTATGADAAPTFTSTETGTAGGMDCVLFELSGWKTTAAVDVSATYASGASAGTLSAMTATTAATAVSGEFAISIFAQEAAAASLTWVDAGTSGLFSKILNGNGVSSVLQTYVGVSASNTGGSTLNDAGAFSTDTTAFGAGLVVVFASAAQITQAVYTPISFANNAAATVTTGGTTAPSAGTVETWTVNVTGAFPVASATTGPPTCFLVADLALNAEKFLVTTAPGGTGSSQTWTVTRGADGTTPAAHTAGFSIVEVTSAGFLSAVSTQTYAIAYVECDYTGTTDASAAFNAALASLPLVNGWPAGIIQFGPGAVKMAVTPNNPGPQVFVKGAGWWATTIWSYVNAGDCFRSFNPSSLYVGAGGISGMTIRGDNATGAAVGLHIGDQSNYRVDVTILNFQGTGAKGVWFDNEYFWCEQMEGDIYVSGCTQCVVFDNPSTAASTSSGSFDRLNMTVWLEQGLNGSGQVWGDGVVLQNGAIITDGRLSIYGNFSLSLASTSAAVLRIIGTTPTGHAYTYTSHISYSHLDIGVELDPHAAYTFAPMSIYSDGSGFINACYGILDFGAASGVFTASNIANLLSNSIFIVSGDANLSMATDVEFFCVLASSHTLTTATTAQPLLNATTNGTVAIAPGLWNFECEFDITGLSSSTHTVSFGLAGTATVSSVKYLAESNTGAAGTVAVWQNVLVTSASATALNATATTTTFQAMLRGVIRVSAGGTLIPQLTNNVGIAAVVSANSWFRLWPVSGTSTAATAGVWT